jgi:hypothetical protein
MKIIKGEHRSKQIILKPKHRHHCETKIEHTHWEDDEELNSTLYITHGGVQLHLYISVEKLRALAKILSESADSLEAHQAQIDAEAACPA